MEPRPEIYFEVSFEVYHLTILYHFNGIYEQELYQTCLWALLTPLLTISFPEAAILLESDGDHDLWPGPTPEVRDSRSLCTCPESSLTNLIGSGLNLLCSQSHSKLECSWTWPRVPISST